VLRHSLAEVASLTGISRSAVHSMPAGCPVYQRMGYEPVRQFSLYAWP
jgi:hypothetical protein